MPTLTQSLQGHDLGHLRIIASLWGIDFDAPDTRVGLARLAPLLVDRARLEETVLDLPADARRALDDLYHHEGRLPWPLFTRRYGVVREMGPGRRDRERPYGKSASPAEMLWYRALAARAFFDGPSGPEEYAYIPEDILPLLPPPGDAATVPLGRPATPAEREYIIPASDRILDDATTLLAALRISLTPVPALLCPDAFLQLLFSSAGLIDASGLPMSEPVRAFLEATRGEALARLASAWLHSEKVNDLRLLPGLAFEGEWQNDPLRARQAVLDFLSAVPSEKWWCLPAFIEGVRQRHPDFQRPAGDYDSWFIRPQDSDQFLRGFNHWGQVDGALIHYIITGPMHWLGMVEIAAPAEGKSVTAFRYSPWAKALLSGAAPDGLPVENEKLKLGSGARLRVVRLAPRPVRYQIARFCEWEEAQPDAYRYRLTPSSLARARQQGLTVAHLLALLRRHADAVPPTLVKALERWEQHGTEATVEQMTVLRLASPELLQTLRASRAARFLDDPLGPTTVVVRPGAAEKVLAVLAEMGYLGEGRVEDESTDK
jgi:Helicase conserved C-terminal domain